MPNVQVVQESRAAFIFARESGLLSQAQLQDAILLIDVGASTTDLTYIKGLHIQDEPVGHQLGAGLIDEVLLHLNLQNQPEIEAYVEQYAPARKRCLLACRRAKEEYFTNGQRAGGKFEDLTDTLSFTARVNEAMIARSLQEPLAALGGQSWAGTYRRLLEEMREKLELQAQRANLASTAHLPKHILLTGGASRMPLIRQLCLEVFPECTTPLHEAEPQFCVAKGLAEFARWRHRVEQFRVDIKTFAEREHIMQLLLPHFKELLNILWGRNLLEQVFEEVLRPWIYYWRHHDT